MLAQRIASAGQGLKDGQSSSDVFSQHFFSSEGWYSDAVFKSQMNVKIIGRSFDDYHSDPVVLIGGMMMRCQREQMQECIARATNHTVAHPSIHLMPPIQETRVEAHLSSDSCFMGWLPDQVRQW